MLAKVPWIPQAIPPGARVEVCDQCHRKALIPWTLRRDIRSKALIRTWACTSCQALIERAEPE